MSAFPERLETWAVWGALLNAHVQDANALQKYRL